MESYLVLYDHITPSTILQTCEITYCNDISDVSKQLLTSLIYYNNDIIQKTKFFGKCKHSKHSNLFSEKLYFFELCRCRS